MTAKEFVKKLTTTTTVNPYLSAPTGDTGAQVIMLGQNHLDKIGLNISCLLSTPHDSSSGLHEHISKRSHGRLLRMYQG